MFSRSSKTSTMGHRIGSDVVVFHADLREKIRSACGKYLDYAGLNFEISLTINGNVYDAVSREGASNLLQFMVDDANRKTESTVRSIVRTVKAYEQKKNEAGRFRGATTRRSEAGRFTSASKRMEILIPAAADLKQEIGRSIKDLCRQLDRVPEEWWSKYLKDKKEYKSYKIVSGLKIAMGGMMLTGTALSIAAAVPSGGASLALGIVSAQRGTVDLYQKVVKLRQDAEKVLKSLTEDIKTLCRTFEASHGTARLGGREMGRAVTKAVTGFDGGIVTVSACKAKLKLLKEKQKGLLVRGTKLSRDLEPGKEAKADDVDFRS